MKFDKFINEYTLEVLSGTGTGSTGEALASAIFIFYLFILHKVPIPDFALYQGDGTDARCY